MSFRAVLSVGVLAACAGSSEAPPRVACTEIGCQNGLSLQFQPDSGWAPGAYRLRLNIDGTAVTCEGQLPLGPCDQGSSFTCDAPIARVGESGCALPAAQHGLADLFIDSTSVKSVGFSLERDGQRVAFTTLKPSFVVSRPNGPDCPPVCTSATVVLPLTDVSGATQ